MPPILNDGLVTVFPLDRFNWEEVIPLKVQENQQDFLPENLFSVAQSSFENSDLYGIRYQEKTVGMMVCLNQGSMVWISRIMVDAAFQSKGIGRRALQLQLQYLNGLPSIREVRTSVSDANTFALSLFESLGFKALGAPVGGELVLKYEK